MRKDRGNIILTAIFISVFLFFLSVALLWTNRQDIALSLAMEHKMKGEAAARSGAMTVYANLRSFGRPPAAMEASLESGASWKAELLELEPEGDRGPKMLVRCRGTSGPMSSYYTLHLLKTDLSKAGPSGEGRMLAFFPPPSGIQASGSAEVGAAGGGDTSQSAGSIQATFDTFASVLFGDFELRKLDMQLDASVEYLAGSEGPLFASGKLAVPGSPLAVTAYLPVFDPLGGALRAYGPLVITAPKARTEYGLSVLRRQGEEFQWEAIPFPIEEPEVPSVPPIGLLELKDSGQADQWNSVSARAVASTGASFAWSDSEPPTSRESEAPNIVATETFELNTGAAVDWGSVRPVPPKRGYVLRSAIAARKEAVYSHAWEYLYRHYDGVPSPAPVPRVFGNTIIRWPCVRKYDLGNKAWSTAWSALGDDGQVKSTVVPDSSVLFAGANDTLYSRTLENPSRLLTLEAGGRVAVGKPLNNGNLFIYQDKPYTISNRSGKPGLLNLLDDSVIGFESLPARLPEVTGMVVANIENEEYAMLGTSALDVSSFNGDGDAVPVMRTIRRRHDFSYSLSPTAGVTVDGDDLYASLIITVNRAEPTYETFGSDKLNDPPPSGVLARFDGERWHILPGGLMAQLVNGLPAPSGLPFSLTYAGLPGNISRYSVIAIDTDPFEFKE